MKRKAQRVTITEVARLAGVSLGTASHVLNNTSSVSEKLRKRVLDAVQELNYTPNLVARSLRSKATGTVGVIVSNLENPFFTEVAQAIQDTVYKLGYHVIICSSYEDPNVERGHILTLLSKQVDGLVIAPTGEQNDLLATLNKEGVPMVIVSRRLQNLRVPAVISDNVDGCRKATNHLLERGYRRIGILLHDKGASVSNDQLTGYRDALTASGKKYDENLVGWTRNNVESGVELTEKLMQVSDPPTAVICSTAMLTIGTLEYIRSRKLSCPDDLAVIGFGNMPWARVMSPRLSHVTQPTLEIGKQTVQQLLSVMKGKLEDQVPVIVLPCGFDHGETCGCTYPQ